MQLKIIVNMLSPGFELAHQMPADIQNDGLSFVVHAASTPD
jgi:hypothetical protein